MDKDEKTIGQAIDEIIRALQPLNESSRITAVRASCDHLDIPITERSKEMAASGQQMPPTSPTTSSFQLDIKSFKEQKLPSSANEMAALVAFYLTESAPEHDRKTEVDVNDMTKYFKQASFPLPTSPKDLLVKARNAGYFDSVGSGKYKLNPVGYNLVAHNLPRSQSGIAGKPVRNRRGTKKSKQGSSTKKPRDKSK